MKLKEGIEINESSFEHNINSEFANLCNFLLNEEFEKLENSIKIDGCRDPLVIWDEKDILLDGHHRLYFCQKYNKSYQIIKKSFPDKFSALLWTWTNDKGRRGSGDSPYYDCETVILKFKDGLEKRARGQQGERTDILTRGSKSIKPINVRKELASLAHYSEQTVNRTKFIMEYADKETKEKLRKRRPEVQFRALAEKLMMLYPEKQDSDEELEFKKSLDKETILDTLNLPQAQSFIKATKEIENITPKQQKKVAKKLKEEKITDVESMKAELLDEKYPNEERGKKEIEFADYIADCSKKVDSLKDNIKTLLDYKKDFDSEYYKRSFERWNLMEAIESLLFYINKLNGVKNETKEKKENIPAQITR